MTIYKHTGGLSPARSMFNLSYSKMLTMDMGQLIPVICDEAVPGDIWQIGSEAVIRMQPLVAPVMHEINVYLHLYFVPYRILWPKNDAETDGWEVFITGGQTGDLEPVQPVWEPAADTEMAVNSLWDYFGFPVGLSAAAMEGPFRSITRAARTALYGTSFTATKISRQNGCYPIQLLPIAPGTKIISPARNPGNLVVFPLHCL